MNFPNNSFPRHIRAGWHAARAVKYGISGLLHLETTCKVCFSCENGCTPLPWFSWSRCGVFICSNHFSLCSLARRLGWWSAEDTCRRSSKSIREMIHILEIHPRVHGGSRLILKLNPNNKNNSPATCWKYIEPDCTVVYYIVYMASSGEASSTVLELFIISTS